MKFKIKICIAIMLTVILGVNVIAFASYENEIVENEIIITEEKIIEKNNEFEYSGVSVGKFVSASQLKEERMRYIATTTITAVTLSLIFYFLVKIMVFFRANKRYKKAIQEGKEVENPKIKIKLKYLLLLFIAIDVLIWITVIMMNLL